MQVPGSNLTPQYVKQQAIEISTKVKRIKQEFFGNRSVVVKQGDPIYDKVNQKIAEMVKHFPTSDNGSRFIESTVKVVPTLRVNFSHLRSLFKDATPGNLFLDEVGKTIDFGPLHDEDLGDFTTSNTALKLTNIRFKPGAILQPKEHKDIVDGDKEYIALNASTTCGFIDTNPELQQTELIANVTFGNFKAENMVIPLETLGDETTTELVIELDPISCEISPDGRISLPNGKVCEIKTLVGHDNPLEWVDYVLKVPSTFEP